MAIKKAGMIEFFFDDDKFRLQVAGESGVPQNVMARLAKAACAAEEIWDSSQEDEK